MRSRSTAACLLFTLLLVRDRDDRVRPAAARARAPPRDRARRSATSSAASAGAGRGRIAVVRALIVASQVAVTCVLVIGGALLTRSFSPRRSAPTAATIRATWSPHRYRFRRVIRPSGKTAAALTRIVERLKASAGDHACRLRARRCRWCPPADSRRSASHRPIRERRRRRRPRSIRRVVTPRILRRAWHPHSRGTRADRCRYRRPHRLCRGRQSIVRARSYLDDIPIERAIGMSLGPNAVRSRQRQGGSDRLQA